MQSVSAEGQKNQESFDYITIQNNPIDFNILTYEHGSWIIFFFLPLTLSFSTGSVFCYCILTRVKTSSCSTMFSKALPRDGEMSVCLSTLCIADSLSSSDFLFELVAKTEAGGYCKSSRLTSSYNTETPFEDSVAFAFI